MQMRIALLSALFVLAPSGAQAACLDAFDDLKVHIVEDYVAYPLAFERDASFAALSERLRVDASIAPDEACTPVLDELVAYLDDPHVFISEQPEFTEEEAAALRTAKPRTALELARVREQAARARNPNRVEGLWASTDFDVAIIPEPGGRGRLMAVVVESRSENWAPGDIAARFERADDGAYNATVYRTSDFAPTRYRAALQRGVLLHMPPITWGRIAPLGERDAGVFGARQPRTPTFRLLSDDAALLSAPSFSPEHQEALSNLLTSNDAAIRARRLLIVDLRGNEGGSSYLGALLAPYYYDPNVRPYVGAAAYPMARSSPRMIRYFNLMIENTSPGGWRDTMTTLVQRMAAAPGQLVPLYGREEAARWIEPSVPETFGPSPQRVAIIVDRHVVSAGEAFLLDARRSPKVTLYGENSGGSIDYQNVTMFAFGEGRLSYYLGLPTIAGSDELPERGFNRDGIPVDVRLRAGGDWIDAVLRQERRRL